ncbi:MAG TPA: glycoside hydrolase family 28 protein, partial [Verrucomicrobiae bacterium]|nr:glycoside hydrolase family 28 protein [Verrucomicrobiae bacterium]
SNTVRMTLRFHAGDWWDGDRERHDTSRQRAEVKGIGPHQKTGETFEYETTWRTSPNFYGTGRFCHVFQLKALNGENGPPLVTLSVKEGTNDCAVQLWSGNSRGAKPVREFHWSPGVWENVRIRIKTSNSNDGEVLVSVNGDEFQGLTNVAVYRPNATAYRPKWGLYRGTSPNLPPGESYVEHKNASATKIVETPYVVRGWEMVPEILSRIVPPKFPDRDFNVIKYGADTNGSTDSLPAFKTAIVACNLARGGNVIVPAGNYRLDGSVHLLDYVNLHLETNAVLNFTADPKFYLPAVLVKWEGVRCYNYSPLIYGYQLHNIALTGAGVINGGYSNFWNQWNFKVEAPDQKLLEQMGHDLVPVEKRIFGAGHLLRPYGIQFYDCENVLVDGITMKASPMWSLSPVFCSNVTIRNYKVTPGYLNDDGCDPDSCIDTLIENCDFDTADDNIAIKAGRDNDAWPENGGRECENLIIRNNYFRATRNNAIAIGSEMSGGVKNVFAENNTFSKVPKYVVYLKGNSDRGGYIENVWMRNNFGAHTSSRVAFEIDSGFNGATNHPYAPLYRDLHFENFQFGRTGTGIAINGLPQKPITNVFFKNITIASATNPTSIKFADDVNFENVKIGGALVQP